MLHFLVIDRHKVNNFMKIRCPANTILCANTKLLVDDEMMNVYVHELREKRDRHLVKTI